MTLKIGFYLQRIEYDNPVTILSPFPYTAYMELDMGRL